MPLQTIPLQKDNLSPISYFHRKTHIRKIHYVPCVHLLTVYLEASTEVNLTIVNASTAKLLSPSLCVH